MDFNIVTNRPYNHATGCLTLMVEKLVKDKIYKSLCSQLRAAEAEVAEEAWSK